MSKSNKAISFEEYGDCSTELRKQFQTNMEAFEQAPWGQTFEVLLDSGISLPPPAELADTELTAKLWEVINALALLGAFLEHTDHLNDRELYTLLWDDILREETVFPSSEPHLVCHIDIIGSGSEQDNAVYLKYYAGEDDRSLWARDYPDEPLPSRERLPFDRDRHLPKPDPNEKFDVH